MLYPSASSLARGSLNKVQRQYYHSHYAIRCMVQHCEDPSIRQPSGLQSGIHRTTRAHNHNSCLSLSPSVPQTETIQRPWTILRSLSSHHHHHPPSPGARQHSQQHGDKIPFAQLHSFILRHIIDNGYSPTFGELAKRFLGDDHLPHQTILKERLEELQDYHGVVLHPNSSEIWACHPFSAAPTNFTLRRQRRCCCGKRINSSDDGKTYWGNCAWCSLGAAALLSQGKTTSPNGGGSGGAEDSIITISTTLGGEQSAPVELRVENGTLHQCGNNEDQQAEQDYVVHFPIPMTQAWDNVVYTCSLMLLFRNEAHVDDWCSRYRIPKGDVQPVQKVWEFASKWYGNHLAEDWEKWTLAEAKSIFEEFGLTHDVWHLPTAEGRF